MSHATGAVIVDNKGVAFFDYNGTSDVCVSNLVESIDDVHFRKMKWIYCTCGDPSTDCFLYSSYGGGYYWPGKVCMKCKAITEGLQPYEVSCDDRMCNKYGCDHWPKDGHPLKADYDPWSDDPFPVTLTD